MIQILTSVPEVQVDKVANTKDMRNQKIMQAAQDFEGAFIAQMLKYSGLDKALISGDGHTMAPFTDFYLDALSERIVDAGGFGLVDQFYDRIARMNE